MNHDQHSLFWISRRSIGLLVAFFMVTSAITVTAESFDGQSITFEDNQMKYTIEFERPSFSEISTATQEFTSVSMSGCMAVSMDYGAPSLPIENVKILIPAQKEVSSVVVDGTPVEVKTLDVPVVPYQEPVHFNDDMPDELMIDEEVYASHESYPLENNEGYNVMYSHGYAILDVTLNPVEYVPAEGIVRYYPEMEITIELEDTQEVNEFYRADTEDREYVETLVFNPEVSETYNTNLPKSEYPGGLCDPSDTYRYVIITTEYNGLDGWSTGGSTPYNWQSLITRYNNEGLRATLVTIQDIDATSAYQNSNPLFDDLEAHIREFCKDAYQDWGTQYVLIGGDDEWIPAREMDTSYEGNLDTDIYWSNLDSTFNDDQDTSWGEAGDSGFDYYAELFIGRLTCDEPQDVSNWMTKSFYYRDSSDADYLDNFAGYGGNTGWQCQGDDFIDYAAIYGVTNWLGPNPNSDGPYPSFMGFRYGFLTWNEDHPDDAFNMDVMWSADSPNTYWEGGNEATAVAGLRADISNDQVTLISGIAHANADMSLDVYCSEWESEYHNTKPFFIHDFGCHCGDMDASDDGVLHSMLFYSDTELAFGCVYNTGYGWGNFDTTNSSSSMQAKLFWDWFLNPDNTEDISDWQLGKAQTFSKDMMAPTVNWGYTWRSIVQSCLLFGDPAQVLKNPHPNDAPETPQPPTGPEHGYQYEEYSFSAVTTDPEGHNITYRFDWGDGNFDEVGPVASGTEVTLNHIWEYSGYISVRVKAIDEEGRESAWSAGHGIQIDVPPEPRLYIGVITGGFLKVASSVSNEGNLEATDVEWNITFDGGFLLAGQETEGTIPSLPIDAKEIIQSNTVIGFGLSRIYVNAKCAGNHISEHFDDRDQGAQLSSSILTSILAADTRVVC